MRNFDALVDRVERDRDRSAGYGEVAEEVGRRETLNRRRERETFQEEGSG